MTKVSVIVGERYRRRTFPHDFVWIRSYDGQSTSLITKEGPRSMPVAAFVEKFEAAPRRKGKRS